jgi:hypothetical protein
MYIDIHIQVAIESSLKNIIQDPENGVIEESASIPSSLLLILEQLRGNLNELQGTVNKNQSNTDDIRKGKKRKRYECFVY